MEIGRFKAMKHKKSGKLQGPLWEIEKENIAPGLRAHYDLVTVEIREVVDIDLREVEKDLCKILCEELLCLITQGFDTVELILEYLRGLGLIHKPQYVDRPELLDRICEMVQGNLQTYLVPEKDMRLIGHSIMAVLEEKKLIIDNENNKKSLTG